MIFLLMESIWFWVFVVGLFGLFMICEAKESGTSSFCLFVGTVIGLEVYGVKWGGFDIVAYVRDHAREVLLCLLAYVGVGIPWSMLRWYMYCQNCVEKYRQEKAEWKTKYGGEVSVAEQPAAWRKYFQDRRIHYYYDFPPSVKKNKARIARWMGCWFTSLIWTLCSDFLTKGLQHIVTLLSGVFQSISNRVFAKHLNELSELDKP